MEYPVEGSDLTVHVEKKIFFCHKFNFAAKSLYFRRLWQKENGRVLPNKLELSHVSVESFKIILAYLYDRIVFFDKFSAETYMEVIQYARRFEMPEMETLFFNNLQRAISAENAVLVYSWTAFFHDASVQAYCLRLIYPNATKFLTDELYLPLSKALLIPIFSSDYFFEDELFIFQSICRWMEHNKQVEASDLLSCVRLPLISNSRLSQIRKPTERSRLQELKQIIQNKTNNNNEICNIRAKYCPEVNVATKIYGARVIEGLTHPDLLNGDCDSYNVELHTRPNIICPKSNLMERITVIELGNPTFINFIEIRFTSSFHNKYYSFGVEVSLDNINWSPVAQYENTKLFRLEYFSFLDKIIRYIRVTGYLNSTEMCVFCLETIACRYNPERLDWRSKPPHVTLNESILRSLPRQVFDDE